MPYDNFLAGVPLRTADPAAPTRQFSTAEMARRDASITRMRATLRAIAEGADFPARVAANAMAIEAEYERHHREGEMNITCVPDSARFADRKLP